MLSPPAFCPTREMSSAASESIFSRCRSYDLSARGDGGLKPQQHFHHGSYAQKMLVPTETAIPLGSTDAAEAEHWCAMTVGVIAAPVS